MAPADSMDALSTMPLSAHRKYCTPNECLLAKHTAVKKYAVRCWKVPKPPVRAIRAKVRRVRILPVQPRRSEGPEFLDLLFRQRAANDRSEPNADSTKIYRLHLQYLHRRVK